MDIQLARAADAAELAEFFLANVDTEFISHSELQGYRAETPNRWAPNAADVILADIKTRLAKSSQSASAFVAEGRNRGTLLSVALFSLCRDAAIPFAILQDLVVDEKARAKGHGKEMLSWVASFVRKNGIDRIFLESGIRNERAHYFFEKAGFTPISVVMMWDMPGK